MLLSGIGYAPALLPDELLYSWVARLAVLNAMGTPRECLARIFGCDTLVPGIDLPTSLLAVWQQLEGWLPFGTVDELLDAGTLLPYHRPFLTELRYESVRQTLLRGNGKGLKTQMGRVANRFGANPSLRWCAQCSTNSLVRHGSPYWMRRHQLPGVSCCTIHGIQLQHVQLSTRTNSQQLILPSPAATMPQQQQQRADAQQLRFAALSEELLVSELPVINPKQRSTAYRDAAMALGYRSRHGRVDYPGLSVAVRRQFGDFEGFDHRERLLSTSARPLRWIADLIERSDRSAHPICHLVLIDFLFGSVAAFKNACTALSHADTPTAREAALQFSYVEDRSPAAPPAIDSEAVLQDTALSCRRAARMLGKSVTTIVSQRRARGIAIRERRKSITPAVMKRIRLELNTSTPPSIVASRCGVSVSTVYRVRAQLPSSGPTQLVQRLEEETAMRRRRWTMALNSCRAAGGKAARGIAPADYAWLYRHDREWLASTTMTARRPRVPRARVDWAERDAQLTELMLKHLEVLRSETPPTRITRDRLIRPLGKAMVQRNQQRLPNLHSQINQAAESQEEFRVRRVDYAIASIVRTGQDLKLWRVKRLSGLRLWSEALTAHANYRISRLNAQNPVRPDRLS